MLSTVKQIAIKTLKIDLCDVLDSVRDTSIMLDDKNALRAILGRTSEIKGNGGAVFLGEGTEGEYQEMIEKESGWYHKLKTWGLK